MSSGWAEHGARSLVLASGNQGKLRELSAMLQPGGWDVRAQSEWNIPEAVEDGLTFVENALIKARHASQHAGLPALADDSGLVVDFLDGAPGIFSSRYAQLHGDDAANNAKLLQDLQGVPPAQRMAHFYCAMVVVRHRADPAPLVAIGAWHGSVLTELRGSGGFGYDPLFWVDEHQCSAAELGSAVKNEISHRARAIRSLARQFAESGF